MSVFPFLPLGFLRLSASNRIPSSLIPFSKNVIRKKPIGVFYRPALFLCGLGGRVLHHHHHFQFLSHGLHSNSPLPFVLIGAGRKATYGSCCPCVLQMIARGPVSLQVWLHIHLSLSFMRGKSTELIVLFQYSCLGHAGDRNSTFKAYLQFLTAWVSYFFLQFWP